MQNNSFDKFKFHFISLVLGVKFYLVLREEVRDYNRFHCLWPEFDKDIWKIAQRWDICLIYWLASRKNISCLDLFLEEKKKLEG